MKTQSGFTLIELIVVMMILAIVAASVAPRLVPLDRDARLAAIEQLYAAVKGAADQVYLQAAINGVEDLPRCRYGEPGNTSSSVCDNPVDFANGHIELKYGYPETYAEHGENIGIVEMLDLDDSWQKCFLPDDDSPSSSCTDTGNSSSDDVRIGFNTSDTTACYVQYSEAGSSTQKYALKQVVTGC